MRAPTAIDRVQEDRHLRSPVLRHRDEFHVRRYVRARSTYVRGASRASERVYTRARYTDGRKCAYRRRRSRGWRGRTFETRPLRPTISQRRYASQGRANGRAIYILRFVQKNKKKKKSPSRAYTYYTFARVPPCAISKGPL